MEPTDLNRRAWDEVHRRRTTAMRGRLGLPQVVRAALGELTGRRVLHLQCATGESTVELAALVVFSAFSSPAHRGHGTHPVSRSLQIQR